MDRDRSPQQTAVRGVALLIVLAGIGALIVNKGWHDTGDGGSASATETTVTTLAPTETIPEITTVAPTLPPTTLPAPSGDTKIVVANGSTGVQGAAGRLGDQLTGAGFTVTKKTNILSQEPQAITIVYFLDGFSGQASAVANAVATATVVPETRLMPETLPIPVADLGEAQILVVLGTDLAK